MKKSLVALLLAVALAVPAFAQKGDMSVNAKVGLGLSNNFNLSGGDIPDDCWEGIKMEMPVSLGAEFFYEAIDSLSLGLGVNYTFDSDSKSEIDGGKPKAGTTNVYLAVKPEAKLDSSIFSSIYAIGQIGVSFLRTESRGESFSTDAGIYLGFGAGTVIKDAFIVELILSSSNGKISDYDADVQYTATTLNVGYKFAL